MDAEADHDVGDDRVCLDLVEEADVGGGEEGGWEGGGAVEGFHEEALLDLRLKIIHRDIVLDR